MVIVTYSTHMTSTTPLMQFILHFDSLEDADKGVVELLEPYLLCVHGVWARGSIQP